MRLFAIRLNRWDRALAVLTALYLLLWPLESLSSTILVVRSLLQAAIILLALFTLSRLGVRGARMLTRRFLWRVRHRMALAYVLVGVVPLTLALLLGALGLLLVAGPLAAYLASAEIDSRAAALYATADSLAWQLVAAEPQQRYDIGRRFMEEASRRYPGLMARFETPAGPVSVPEGFRLDDPPASLPSYRGVVRRGGDLYLAAYAQFEPGAPSLLLMVPLTRAYLLEMTPGLGVVERSSNLLERVSAAQGVGPKARAALAGGGVTQLAEGEDVDAPLLARLPEPAHPFDWPIAWPLRTRVLDWASGAERPDEILVFRSRPSAIVRLIFEPQSPRMQRVAAWLGRTLAISFLVALALSTVVAVSLTRTITRAVSELYAGTRRVDRGDFSYRVPIRGYTQLTELARSFNSMTASIERLIEDSKEKQRLESEIGIAREVQQQLFPREAPNLDTLEVTGVCLAARSVSGDFYDYVPLGEGRVALSFGDVSGKGISAALVMAAVHSTVRTQLALQAAEINDAELGAMTARVVTETNRQLCDGTAPNQFATLFFAIYEERGSTLYYTNAGHLPPILVRSGRARRLAVDGMVVGAFAHAEYSSSALRLEPGDLLTAFTDGVTEPENPYEEQYGEERLAETLVREADRPAADIVRTVMDEVRDWTGGETDQQFDDMTLMVARRKHERTVS